MGAPGEICQLHLKCSGMHIYEAMCVIAIRSSWQSFLRDITTRPARFKFLEAKILDFLKT